MRKSTDIIQVALILSAIDTALQAFAPFRRIGGGLPIVMGVSFAFLPALQAMGASGFSFGALLGGEIVGGAGAVLFGLAREQEVANLVLFVGGRIASSADVMRRQAALQPPLLRARLSNYVIASYIIGRHNIASYNVKEAEGPSCVVGDGALPDRVVFSIFG